MLLVPSSMDCSEDICKRLLSGEIYGRAMVGRLCDLCHIIHVSVEINGSGHGLLSPFVASPRQTGWL